jgi:hypothetical protein
MKPLNQDELYENLRGFLKGKGIELQEGSYARGIQKSCSLLSDAINLGQQGLDRAKTGIDKKLDQMRQVIHEKTAPKATAAPPKPESTQTSAAEPPAAAAKPKHGTRKKSKARKAR